MFPGHRAGMPLPRIFTAPGSTQRTGLPESRPYRYRGCGEDLLTAWMDEPELVPVEVTWLMSRMCAACLDDCGGCAGPPCPCACQDEPRGAA